MFSLRQARLAHRGVRGRAWPVFGRWVTPRMRGRGRDAAPPWGRRGSRRSGQDVDVFVGGG
jgi:hypothetical protein